MASETATIRKLTNNKSKVSCHYFIKTNGEIVQLFEFIYSLACWYLIWKNDKNLNPNSIGIEISNPGHEHSYKI